MSTLEELLAVEGFERARQKTKPVSRRCTSARSASNSPIPRVGFSGPINCPVRTHSDANMQRSVSLMPDKSGFTDPSPNKAAGGSHEKQSLDAQQSKVLISQEKYEYGRTSVKKQLDVKFNSIKFMGSNDVFSKVIEGKQGYDMCYKNELYEYERKSSENQTLQVRPVFENAKNGCPVSTLDEAALKAIISMISSCVDRLVKDASFRYTVHQACISSLNTGEAGSRQAKNKDVLSTLKETIGYVERMITEDPNQMELKKASLKLSVITGLKISESEDGYTSGFPNSHLAGCAHLYLSILYKMQKKDKVSAKHLLQVFCYSPNQARTKLLPELWRCIFLSQFTHLKEWYDKETRSIYETSEMMLKMEVLDKVYNDILDEGTSQFAAHYKGWLMDDNSEATLPSILVPLVPFNELAGDSNEVISVESPTPSNSFISKSVISKGLYESVLGQANRTETASIMVSWKEEKTDEGESETEQGQSDACKNRYDDSRQKDEETGSHSSSSGIYATESFHEYYSAGSEDWGASFEENNQSNDKSSGLSSSSIIDMDEMRAESELVQPWHNIKGCIHVGNGDLLENNNKPKMKKLAQDAFQIQSINDDAYNHYPVQSIDISCYDSYTNELTEVTHTTSSNEETDITHKLSSLCSLQESSSAMLFGYHADIDQASFARVPKCFICPLTGLILKEPVTLESGYTFELAAIKKRFDLGIKTCPVTGQSMKYSTIPETNIVFKHLINEWVAECFRNSSSCTVKQICNSKNELAFSIFEQLLSGFSSEDKKENIKHLIALGGLQFLTQMFELGSLEKKSCAAELLVQCIRADGYYRKCLAMNIRKSSFLELFHDGQVHEKTNASSLLIELIRLNRRMDITSFLSGLKTETSCTIMSDLLLCLKSSLPEERVLVAVLLLQLDLMEESQTYSSFSGEAVRCIITTLECCLSNNKFIPNCRDALFMLGGHFSSSGETLTEIWLLKQAGFDCYPLGCNEDDNETVTQEEEIKREDWLKSMTLLLVHYKRKSFIETLSKCWKLGSPDLARVCLVTTAWLSLALPSLSVPASQLSACSALLPRLKESFRSDLDIRHRVLACLCLFNFSKIPECRSSLKAIAEEILEPLHSLQEATWTARHLYNDFSDETSL